MEESASVGVFYGGFGKFGSAHQDAEARNIPLGNSNPFFGFPLSWGCLCHVDRDEILDTTGRPVSVNERSAREFSVITGLSLSSRLRRSLRGSLEERRKLNSSSKSRSRSTSQAEWSHMRALPSLTQVGSGTSGSCGRVFFPH